MRQQGSVCGGGMTGLDLDHEDYLLAQMDELAARCEPSADVLAEVARPRDGVFL